MPSIFERMRNFIRPNVIQISLGSDAPTQVLNYTAKTLYQTQDNLQAVVNYLASSIAQLPLKVYKRDGETDRKRDRDSVAAKVLWKPNDYQTCFEFVRAIATEYYVFGCVYVWVTPDADNESGYQLLIIPSEWVQSTSGGNVYAPDKIRVSTTNGLVTEIPSSEFVQFKTYSPGNPGGYLSPITGLRQTLQEQIEAGRFRKQLWHSSGRLNAQILRPKDVQPWDDETRKRFITAFREAWGPNGAKAGSIPLMEDGMEIKPFQTSFKEQQWAESIQLSREAVAAAYRINSSLIWHTNTQTYASARDNARALYAECLGPDLQMFQQRINDFLLPMIRADKSTYVEFDLTEKLKGSFEERAGIMQSSVGGPWLTRNEARADYNLPPIEGGDELIVPLNVIEGGQASPTDTHMDEQEPMTTEPAKMRRKSEALKIKGISEREEDEAVSKVLSRFFSRQAKSILPKLGAKADWWDEERWDEELTADLIPVIDKIADSHGISTAKLLGSDYIKEKTRNYLKALCKGRAHAINVKTKRDIEKALRELEEALEEEEEEVRTPADVMEKREGFDAEVYGKALATCISGWGMIEACNQAKQQGYSKTIQKEWVTGANARTSHSMMNGEVVGIDDRFSNGARFPGDDNLDPEQSCGCNCSTSVIITEV